MKWASATSVFPLRISHDVLLTSPYLNILCIKLIESIKIVIIFYENKV